MTTIPNPLQGAVFQCPDCKTNLLSIMGVQLVSGMAYLFHCGQDNRDFLMVHAPHIEIGKLPAADGAEYGVLAPRHDLPKILIPSPLSPKTLKPSSN